jgi:RHS repeat-associated protein
VHGNLTGVNGLETYSQSFVYADPTNKHLLTTFNPATGVAPVVNVYDPQGRITTQTLGDQVLTIAYPTETTRTATWVVKDPTGATIHTRVHSFQFQGTDLVKETNALGHELRRFYTPSRDLEREEIWQKPASGALTLLKTTHWTYDGQGRPLTESVTLDSGEVVTTTKTYDHGWVASVETTSSLSSQVFRTEYTFHRNGNGVPVNIHEVKRRRDDGVFAVTKYTYCSAADTTNAAAQCPYERLLKSVDGPRTDVADLTTYAYYTTTDQSGCGSNGPCHRKGDLKRTTNALGHATEALAYDAAGRLVKTQDPNGVVIETTYHIRGWPLTRTVLGDDPASTADDATSTFVYDARGNVTSQTDADGVATAYAYDTRDRLAEVQDATGGRLIYIFDSDGNRLSEEIRDGGNVLKRKRSYSYDKLGRMTTERDAQNRATTYEYDAASRQTAVVDALGHRTQHTYDDLGRLTQTVADAATGGIQATTQFTYDAAGNLRSVIDPKGLNTSYIYNTLGQLTQLQSPDTGTTDYTYDVAGNRLTQTDARAITATHVYDALNRLTGITYADSDYDVGYAYDQADATTGCTDSFEIGRLTTMSDETGTTVYCYDRRNNVARKTQTVDELAMTVGYAYSRANRLAELTYPSGAKIAYARDTQGRITGIDRIDGSNPVSLITGATYLPFGPLTSLAFADGATQAWVYDQNYWIDAISGTALNLDYSTDALGNIDGLPNPTPSEARVYGYDSLSRLTSVKDGSNVVLEAFTYDATGNRLSKRKGAAAQTYGYSAINHRVTTIDTTVRSYDAAGSLIDRGDGWTFEYDPRQRLETVKQNNVVAQISRYNAKDERVARIAETTDRFAYNEAGQLIAELRTTSLAEYRQEFVWLGSRPIAILQHTGAYASEVLDIHSDHLGSPRAVTRSSVHSVAWIWPLTGAAFGEHMAIEDPDNDGISFGLNLRYPGQYFDAAGGLHYNYFRDYEPDAGRYVESDPIGLLGGTSTYSYAVSSSFSKFDPFGLTFYDVVRVNNQVMRTFPGLNPKGGLMCEDLPPGETGYTIGAMDFTLLESGTIQVQMKFCKLKCLDRNQWEILFFTLFHESMHSTDPAWSIEASSDKHHTRIANREIFERTRTARSGMGDGRPMWGTPLPAPGADLDRLYDEYRAGADECCGN